MAASAGEPARGIAGLKIIRGPADALATLPYMATICCTHYGEPMSKGSKTARVLERGGKVIFGRGGKAIAYLYEDKSAEKKRDAKAIAQVAEAARAAAGVPILSEVALAVTLRYWTESPAYRYGTGRNAAILKLTASLWPAKKPDVDKWARHTLDALTGSAYTDDGQVVDLLCQKRYCARSEQPRTEIEVAVIPMQTVGDHADDAQLALA